MKTLILCFALLGVLAVPAFAQSTPPNSLKRNATPIRVVPRPSAIYSARTYDVIEDGVYLGSDPDPNIRLELRRDYELGGGSGGD